MKLVSTDVREGSVELTYADSPDLDDAARLLIVRLPREIDQKKSLAWNRYWTLCDLRDQLSELIETDRKIVESN